MWRGEVRRGRAGQAFEFGEPGVLDGATAKLLAAGRYGPRQVGQIVKTKPLRRNCLRILDQSLEPREPALQATGRLSSPVRSPGFLKGGLDNPLPNHAQGHSRPIERLLRTLTRRARSRAVRSNSTETTMHGSGGPVERRVHDGNQVVAYSVRAPNRVHVAVGQYLYCTSPSTSPRATKPIVRLSRELFRLSPSTKHIPSGTFALG